MMTGGEVPGPYLLDWPSGYSTIRDPCRINLESNPDKALFHIDPSRITSSLIFQIDEALNKSLRLPGGPTASYQAE